jgi:rhodanese-related sulfurtransferase
MRHSPGFLKLVDDAKARVKEVSADEVRRRLEAKDQFILIDVREDSEWNRSHLPQAIHLSRGIIERDIEKSVPDADAEIVLYCGGGFRSALAADNLQKMGYRRVASMAGGFREWCEVGYPLEKT